MLYSNTLHPLSVFPGFFPALWFVSFMSTWSSRGTTSSLPHQAGAVFKMVLYSSGGSCLGTSHLNICVLGGNFILIRTTTSEQLIYPRNYSAWYLIIEETDLGSLSGLIQVIQLVKEVDLSPKFVSSMLPNCTIHTKLFCAITDDHMKACEGTPAVTLILRNVSYNF